MTKLRSIEEQQRRTYGTITPTLLSVSIQCDSIPSIKKHEIQSDRKTG
ncbi:MAG: hypothetical protein ABJM36_03220 [Algibacter sp.]